MYFKREINGVADMAGIKFRAYNAATARVAELAKMLPVQVEAAELSQALATGVAEAFISSGSTGYDRKVWEHLSHFYDTQAWLPRNYVLVNAEAWNGLDEQAQACLRSSAMLAEVAGTTRGARADRLVPCPARRQRHERAGAGRATEGRPGRDRRYHVRGVGRGRRRRGRGDHRSLPGRLRAPRDRTYPLLVVPAAGSRRNEGGATRCRGRHPCCGTSEGCSDALYLAGGLVGAVFLVAILGLILAQMIARWTGNVFPGGTDYAGYAMAGASFFALAYALNRGAHIRVTLVLNSLGRWRRLAEIWCYGVAAVTAVFFARYAVKANIWSHKLNDVSQGQDATPLWIPQIVMSVGTCVLALALVDQFIRVLLTRHPGVETPKLDVGDGGGDGDG